MSPIERQAASIETTASFRVHARRNRAFAYALPLLVAVLVAQTWFRPGTVVAEGDVPPPIAAPTTYTSIWNASTNGEGGPSYSIVEFPYYESLRVMHRLGLSESMSQRLWMTLLYMMVGAGMVFFMFGLGVPALGASAAGLVALLNPYWLVERLNPIPKWSFAVAAVLGGLVLRSGLADVRRWRIVAAAAVTSAGLGLAFANPPHLVMILGWVALSYALGAARWGRTWVRSAFRTGGMGLPLVLAANLWWAVPAIVVIRSPLFHSTLQASSPTAWAWTHVRATVVNALGLNTNWAWTRPEYFPIATRLDAAPLSWARFSIFGIGIIGLPLVPQRVRSLTATLLLALAAGLFLAKGLNAPGARISRWSYDHLPGFWLFREPSKLVMLVLLILCTLLGVAASSLWHERRGLWRRTLIVCAIMLFAANLAYVYPLYTGLLIPTKRPLLPSAYVAVPTEWRVMADYLNAQPDDGKLLVLPLSDFYQQPTIWGYYGVPFTRLLVNRPVIEPSPGGYFTSAGSVGAIADQMQGDLLGTPTDVFATGARALGVTHVLVRGDIDARFPGRSFASPDELKVNLENTPGVIFERSFGDLTLFRVIDSSRLSLAQPVVYWGDWAGLTNALTAARSTAAISETTKAEAQDNIVTDGGTFLVKRVEEPALLRIGGVVAHGHLTLAFSDPVSIALGGSDLGGAAPSEVDLPLPPSPFLITLGDKAFPFPNKVGPFSLGLVSLHDQALVSVWGQGAPELLPPQNFGPLSDCNNYDSRAPAELGFHKDVLSFAGTSGLSLEAARHSACVSSAIPNFDEHRAYQFDFDYRWVQGNRPRICLWLEGPGLCAPAQQLLKTKSWTHVRTLVSPPPNTRSLDAFLYADGDAIDGPTIAQFRNISVSPSNLRGTRRMSDRLLADSRVTLRAGTTPVIVSSTLSSPDRIPMTAFGPVGDCNNYDSRTLSEAGIESHIGGREGSYSLTLSADSHAACVSAEVPDFITGLEYQVDLDYLWHEGNPPRLCIWLVGPNQCASPSSLQRSSRWIHYQTTVTSADAVTGIEVFLYADAPPGARTVAEYSDLTVTPRPRVALSLTPAATTNANQALRTFLATSPTTFRASLSGTGDALIVLAEAYDSRWQLFIDHRRAVEAHHVVANGYANGWLVHTVGNHTVSLGYALSSVSSLAHYISVVTLGLVALFSASMFAVRPWILRRRPRGKIDEP